VEQNSPSATETKDWQFFFSLCIARHLEANHFRNYHQYLLQQFIITQNTCLLHHGSHVGHPSLALSRDHKLKILSLRIELCLQDLRFFSPDASTRQLEL
jgi:hypothetical protein